MTIVVGDGACEWCDGCLYRLAPRTFEAHTPSECIKNLKTEIEELKQAIGEVKS